MVRFLGTDRLRDSEFPPLRRAVTPPGAQFSPPIFNALARHSAEAGRNAHHQRACKSRSDSRGKIAAGTAIHRNRSPFRAMNIHPRFPFAFSLVSSPARPPTDPEPARCKLLNASSS